MHPSEIQLNLGDSGGDTPSPRSPPHRVRQRCSPALLAAPPSTLHLSPPIYPLFFSFPLLISFRYGKLRIPSAADHLHCRWRCSLPAPVAPLLPPSTSQQPPLLLSSSLSQSCFPFIFLDLKSFSPWLKI